MKRNVLVLAILSILFLIFAASLTFAADGKILPGSMGTPTSSNQAYNLIMGTIQNPHTSSYLHVVLPAIHDHGYSDIHSGWVQVVDTNPTGDIYCRLCSHYRSITGGWYGKVTSERSSYGSGLHMQRLNFPGLITTSQSHYYYNCRIPPANGYSISSIISYNVVEYE